MQTDPAKMADIARAHPTVSDKIRALDAAGFERADIARFLNKRYQHVRNVLVAPPPKRSRVAESASADGDDPSGTAGSTNPPGGLIRLRVGDHGQVNLPPSVERALNLKPGGVVVAELHDDQLTLMSPEASIRRAQDLVRALAVDTEGLADSLIADRRREAAGDA